MANAHNTAGNGGIVPGEEEHNMNTEGLNGDQFFTATFSSGGPAPGNQEYNSLALKQQQQQNMADNIARGVSPSVSTEVHPPVPNYARAVVVGAADSGKGNAIGRPMNPIAPLNGQPVAPAVSHLPPGSGGDGFVQQMTTMSLNTNRQTPLQPPQMNTAKGVNVGATEFVPKTNINNGGLTHSSSTPSFSNLQQNQPPPHTMAHLSAINSTIGNLSAATSPLVSPHLSPHGSPVINRRPASTIPGLPPSITRNVIQTDTVMRPPVLQHSAYNSIEAENSRQEINQGMHEDMVGGTTYFYSPESVKAREQNQSVVLPSFTAYTGALPHIAHMKNRTSTQANGQGMPPPSYFLPDDIKTELLNRQAVAMARVEDSQTLDIPETVDNYQLLCPLEPINITPQNKSSTFGYPTSVYKATNVNNGNFYCLRRIHGYRYSSSKGTPVIDIWKKISQSNIVHLRELFTTKAFGNQPSMVFVYDYHPCADTLMNRHFVNNPHSLNGTYIGRQFNNGISNSRNLVSGKGLLQENLIWHYIIQLSAALRTIHNNGLACRVLDPTKILLTDKSRYPRMRINCVGIFDVLSMESAQTDPLSLMPQYQQEDLLSLGKIVLALSCNSVNGISPAMMPTSIEIVTKNYSPDLKNLIVYLLNGRNASKTINDIMPMIGARFYTQIDIAQNCNDLLVDGLSQEAENGRLFRILTKLCYILDRPEFNSDPEWSETGDRYMLKLFRSYLFHQVDQFGGPFLDAAQVIHCLNKLDAASRDMVTLMSFDEQNVIVVSYQELHQCFNASFNAILDLLQNSQVMLHQPPPTSETM